MIAEKKGSFKHRGYARNPLILPQAAALNEQTNSTSGHRKKQKHLMVNQMSLHLFFFLKGHSE